MINRILVAIMSLFLVCGVEATPRNKVVSKGKKQANTHELYVEYKTIDHNAESYRIWFNSENYIYYNDKEFNLMFYNVNYSHIFGNVEQFIIDSEIACNKALKLHSKLNFNNYNFDGTDKTIKCLISRPLYEWYYRIENNKHYIQLYVRENEWSEFKCIFGKEIDKYCDKVAKAFVTSYNNYCLIRNMRNNIENVKREELEKAIYD
jgi:type IV secretory pathway VirB6-like protein